MASWRIQVALVGLLAVCGCGTADNFLHINDADGPTPYGGVRRDWDELSDHLESVVDPDDLGEFAWSAAVATAMLVDLPFSALFDTLTLYPAYQRWGADPRNSVAGDGAANNGAAGNGTGSVDPREAQRARQADWRATERQGFNR